MNKIRVFSVLFVLVVMILPFSIVCVGEGNNSIYTINASRDSNYIVYGSDVVERLTAAEAAIKGMPSGYSDDLYSVKGTGSKGA